MKLIDDANLNILKRLFNNIYNTGIYQEKFIFAVLQQKSYNDCKMISLRSNVLTIGITQNTVWL